MPSSRPQGRAGSFDPSGITKAGISLSLLRRLARNAPGRLQRGGRPAPFPPAGRGHRVTEHDGGGERERTKPESTKPPDCQSEGFEPAPGEGLIRLNLLSRI